MSASAHAYRPAPQCSQLGADESLYRPARPDAVVFVRAAEEVVVVVDACAAHRTPGIGFGAGSSCEGHVLAVQGGVCVDFPELNRIIEIRPGDFTATVEAGATRNHLNDALAGTGLLFWLDPGANATLGGMIARRVGHYYRAL